MLMQNLVNYIVTIIKNIVEIILSNFSDEFMLYYVHKFLYIAIICVKSKH